ncbi:MAG: hypothetical protein FWJ61_10915 [Limnochordales bacterium]
MFLRQLFSTRVLAALLDDRRLRNIDRTVFLRFYYHPLAPISVHASATGIHDRTYRRAAARLLEYGWLYIGTRRGPGGAMILVPWMPPEVETHVANELQRIRNDVFYVGEWLMKCWLDLLVKEHEVWENARLPWAVAGDGSGRLEFDRWYPTWRVAVEFQGSQHFSVGATFSTTEEELRQQQLRDHVKAGVCARHGVTLVEVRAADLTLDALQAKLSRALPLIPVQEFGPLFTALSQMSQSYINHAARGR